jgi:hypothetical protein
LHKLFLALFAAALLWSRCSDFLLANPDIYVNNLTAVVWYWSFTVMGNPALFTFPQFYWASDRFRNILGYISV